MAEFKKASDTPRVLGHVRSPERARLSYKPSPREKTKNAGVDFLVNVTFWASAGSSPDPRLTGTPTPPIVVHLAHFALNGSALFTAMVDETNAGYLNAVVVIPAAHSANGATTVPVTLGLGHDRLVHLNLDDVEKIRKNKLALCDGQTSPAHWIFFLQINSHASRTPVSIPKFGPGLVARGPLSNLPSITPSPKNYAEAENWRDVGRDAA
ncbi:hypothetical protein B0H14DRAFT_3459415 [Mycena olivaceomarginata]|nr:hypothetical protein B0H14DRAFT_3459415 [Mycena olivaceomarginata]